jgi:hypothetical protein
MFPVQFQLSVGDVLPVPLTIADCVIVKSQL